MSDSAWLEVQSSGAFCALVEKARYNGWNLHYSVRGEETHKWFLIRWRHRGVYSLGSEPPYVAGCGFCAMNGQIVSIDEMMDLLSKGPNYQFPEKENEMRKLKVANVGESIVEEKPVRVAIEKDSDGGITLGIIDDDGVMRYRLLDIRRGKIHRRTGVPLEYGFCLNRDGQILMEN